VFKFGEIFLAKFSTDLGKLNFLMVIRLNQIFTTAPAASKTMLGLKGVKIDWKISNSRR